MPYNESVRHKLTQLLQSRGITLHLQERVCEVKEHEVTTVLGKKIQGDAIFWITNASPPAWIKESGLSVDESGFIEVKKTLQSTSHPFVFAAGDIASVLNQPRPKSGVFAVRQGLPLYRNLRNEILGRKLSIYRPQKNFLSLIGTAQDSAIASRKHLSFLSPIMWKLKRSIDKRFIKKFQNLPRMEGSLIPRNGNDIGFRREVSQLEQKALMRCRGCAAKVGPEVLSNVLDRLRKNYPEVLESSSLILGINDREDAAVLRLPEGKRFVQTVDYLPAFVSDPYLFGQIAVRHCFSDIFAMGAKAHSLLATVVTPFGSEKIMESNVYQVLAGVCEGLQQMGATLIGGHTGQGDELALTLVCNGWVDPYKVLRKNGMQVGDAILLTKAIGTGVIFAGEMRMKVKGHLIDAALKEMLLENDRAAQCLVEFGVTSCTDVTGFGLGGHLLDVLKQSKMAAEIQLHTIPLLSGAFEISKKGIRSSLFEQNRRMESLIHGTKMFSHDEYYALLFDPQTSGGLLASVPLERVDGCVEKLKNLGYESTRIIGKAIPASKEQPAIVLTK